MRVFAAVLLLFLTHLLGGDLNLTIVDANESFYKGLLEKISKSKTQSDETALQKALLERILQIPSSPKSDLHPDTKIDSSNKVAELIGRYMENLVKLKKLTSRLEQNRELMENIKERLSRLPEDSNATLTLQLQYALYEKLDRYLRQEIAQIEKEQLQIRKSIEKSLPYIKFDTKKIEKRIEKERELLDRLKKEMESLELDKERYEILGRQELVKRTERKLSGVEQKREDVLLSLLKDKILLFLAYLQTKNRELFALQKDILTLSKEADSSITDDFATFLQSLEKRYLGAATALKGWTLLNAKIAVLRFWKELNEPLFVFGNTPISTFKIIMALFGVIFGFIIGSLYKRSIKRLRRSVSSSTKTLLANLGYYFFVLLGFFIGLNILGVNLSSLTIIAGALSVGIGFGLQNIVSNFVSGLILMFERSVKIGDYVEIDDNLRGHVSDIRMRSTTITTNSNIDIIIPNQEFIQNRVINWTMNDKIRRFEIPFGVAYGTDIDRVKKVILEAVKNSGFKDLYEEPPRRITRVVMTSMGDSSVDFELFVWIRGREILYPKRTVSRFLELIYKTLYKEGIEIPFPQRDIHIKTIEKEIPLIIRSENGK